MYFWKEWSMKDMNVKGTGLSMIPTGFLCFMSAAGVESHRMAEDMIDPAHEGRMGNEYRK